MIRKMSSKIVLVSLILAFVLAFASCGKKGPLVRPAAEIPPPPSATVIVVDISE